MKVTNLLAKLDVKATPVTTKAKPIAQVKKAKNTGKSLRQRVCKLTPLVSSYFLYLKTLINTQYCKAALSYLAKQLANSSPEGKTALVREPYLVKINTGQDHGALGASNYRHRAAILLKNPLSIHWQLNSQQGKSARSILANKPSA